MSWFYLLLAALFEVTWAVAMKYSNGFTVLWPSLITAVTYILSAVFLSFSLKNLNLGMAYALWTGFGIVGTSVLGVFLFQEKLTGEEYGLDVMNDLDGNNVGVSVKRKLAMRSGETDKAVTVDSAEIRKIGLELPGICASRSVRAGYEPGPG